MMKKGKSMDINIRILSFAASAAIFISGCSGKTPENTVSAGTSGTTASTTVTSSAESNETTGQMRDMTTQEIVKDMGLGINLGNTLESCGGWIDEDLGVTAYETAWGSNVITKEIIQGYANEGFGVIRIPVAWSNLMADDYTISTELMNRVDEIVGWAIDSGMYVILNEHWDGGWFAKFPTDTEECMKKYTRIWEQVGDHFKNYSDKLMFESLNEELGKDWDSVWNMYGGSDEGKQTVYDIANSINQKFVDIIRGQGGNNGKRHLLIAGYNTDIDRTCDEMFRMPDDPAGRCAISVHYYTPSTFCLIEKDESWGKARTKWGHKSDIAELERLMGKMKETYVDKSIPVIIGEYGAVTPAAGRSDFQRRRFNLVVAEYAYSSGMCPVLWDTMGTFYDRYECKLKDQEMKNGFNRILNGESIKDDLLAVYDPEAEGSSDAA